MTEEHVTEIELVIPDLQKLQLLVGPRGEYIKRIEGAENVKIGMSGETLRIGGLHQKVMKVKVAIEALRDMLEDAKSISKYDVDAVLRIVEEKGDAAKVLSTVIQFPKIREVIRPRGMSQHHYIDQIRKNDIVFGIGPAGTGKTYLAMAQALEYFYSHRVRKIIIARPAVEAGEKIGYLPGDMLEKVAPYLRPLYDALFDIVGKGEADMLIDLGHVEVGNLGFMRGRTLNDSFVILDEAQNTTRAQMKMVLTRIGFDSRAVITGDISQIDLPKWEESGLVEAKRILNNINGIAFCEFSSEDVVRHPLVRKIIEAYDADQEKRDGETRR